MDILEKAELTASFHYIARFLKSRIPFYNSEVSDTAGRKMRRRRKRRRRTQSIAKCFAFHENATT